jgi:hypothetical protein
MTHDNSTNAHRIEGMTRTRSPQSRVIPAGPLARVIITAATRAARLRRPDATRQMEVSRRQGVEAGVLEAVYG